MMRSSIPARIQTAIVAVLLLVPAVLVPFQNEARLRQFHNRTLVAWPPSDTFLDDPAQYFRQASNWLSDRIGFIIRATILQKRILFYVLDTPPQPRVTLGKSNHVYYNGVSDAGVNGLFVGVCEHGHSHDTFSKLEQAVPAIMDFGRRKQLAIHVVIVPMTPTLYADYLPTSVPRAIRDACMRRLNGDSPLVKLSQQAGVVYPFKEMKAVRDDDGFFPIMNYHPVGLSLKVIRQAYLDKVGLKPNIAETLQPSFATSEILGQYGINKRYPIYVSHNTDISENTQASDRVAERLKDLFVGPPLTSVYTNRRGDAEGTVLLLSDSLGVAAAPVFAAAFKRLIWVYTNGMHRQEQIVELMDRVVSMERFGSVILLVNEGAVARIDEWGAAMGAQERP